MPVNIIDRAKAEALIEEQLIKTIFQEAPKPSTFMLGANRLSANELVISQM